MEQRGDRRYYYTKQRVAGKVVSSYVGGGLRGQLLQACDAAAREQRAQEQAQWQAERAAVEQQDQALAEVEQVLRQLIAGTLEANGYHRHKGQWRRKRGR